MLIGIFPSAYNKSGGRADSPGLGYPTVELNLRAAKGHFQSGSGCKTSCGDAQILEMFLL